MGSNSPPTTGDHVSVSGRLSSASVSDSSGMGLYRHHMLVTSPATVVEDEGVECYKVGIIHLNEEGIVEGEEVLKPGKFRIHTYPSVFTGDDAVRHARLIKKLRPGRGKQVYNLLFYNCESFVREAKTGLPQSRQSMRTALAAIGTPSGALIMAPSGALLGGAIGSLIPIPVVGTVLGGIAGGVVGGALGAALGNVTTAADYAAERILEN